MTTPYDAIIHAGVPKTGSSSIQRFLSYNPELAGPGGVYRYHCMIWNGDLLTGRSITQKATKSGYDYVPSFYDISRASMSETAPDTVGDLRAAEVVPILSNEDWFQQAHKATDLLKLFQRAHVIMYIRPHLEWFNAAWFQWFRWDPEFKMPSDVVAKWGDEFVCFAKAAKAWWKVPGVAKVSVRLLPKDVISDFCGLLGVERPPAENVNTSLSLPLIKLIDLIGARPFDTPKVDFRLARHFPVSDKPWAIDRACAENILSLTKSDSEALMDMLSEDQRHQMREDARWWSYSAYENRPMPDERADLTHEESMDLLRHAVKAVLAMDEKLRPD